MLCILCVSTSDQIINIFDEHGLRLDVSDIITKHFWIQPSAEDCNTKVICYSCWNSLDAFHKFYQKVKEAHLVNIRLPMGDGESETDNFDSYLDFFTSGNDDGLETCESSKIDLPQVDIEWPMEQLDGQNNETEHSVKSISQSEIPLAETKEHEISAKDDKDEQITPNGDDSHSLTTEKSPKKTLTDNDSDYSSPKTRAKRKTVLNDQNLNKKKISRTQFDALIKQNMELSCKICHMELASFFVLKEHYRSVHNEDGYVTCCNRKFNSRHALVHHILLHQNPETFMCEKCGKNMANKRSLKHHMKTHLYDERIYHCDKCKKSFTRKEKLERHLETHVQLEQICEQCGKVCRDKHALRQHQLREHSDVPKQRLQCQKCGVYLADPSTLYTHMKYQHPKTDGNIYKCDICGKISTTGYGLKRHKMYMHTDGPRHKCQMCGKEFKTAQRLRNPTRECRYVQY